MASLKRTNTIPRHWLWLTSLWALRMVQKRLTALLKVKSTLRHLITDLWSKRFQWLTPSKTMSLVNHSLRSSKWVSKKKTRRKSTFKNQMAAPVIQIISSSKKRQTAVKTSSMLRTHLTGSRSTRASSLLTTPMSMSSSRHWVHGTLLRTRAINCKVSKKKQMTKLLKRVKTNF